MIQRTIQRISTGTVAFLAAVAGNASLEGLSNAGAGSYRDRRSRDLHCARVRHAGRRLPAPALLAALLTAGAGSAAAAHGEPGPCSRGHVASTVRGSDVLRSACTVRAGGLAFETAYYQNASRVGGTALAGYPLVHVAAGVTRRLELDYDAPTQFAESGRAGAGLYPHSHTGYGTRYRWLQTRRAAVAATAGILPPISYYAARYSAAAPQPTSVLGMTATYDLAPRVALTGGTEVATPTAGGSLRETDAIGADVALDARTVLAPDLGRRSATLRTRAQAFGDLSLKRRLGVASAFDVGLGSTFNPVARSKAHYLAFGLEFAP